MIQTISTADAAALAAQGWRALSNDQRGQLEQWCIMHGARVRYLPAYVGSLDTDSTHGEVRADFMPRPLTGWTGRQIGTVRLCNRWRNRNGWFSLYTYSASARVNGLDYHGRTGGPGCLINLRLTAESERRAVALGLPVVDTLPAPWAQEAREVTA